MTAKPCAATVILYNFVLLLYRFRGNYDKIASSLLRNPYAAMAHVMVFKKLALTVYKELFEFYAGNTPKHDQFESLRRVNNLFAYFSPVRKLSSVISNM